MNCYVLGVTNGEASTVVVQNQGADRGKLTTDQ